MEGHRGYIQKVPEKSTMQKLSLLEKWTRSVLFQTEKLCSQFAETDKCRSIALLLQKKKKKKVNVSEILYYPNCCISQLILPKLVP